MANSWIFSPSDEGPALDPAVTREHYDRSDAENGDLGLLDMKTENYGETEPPPATTAGGGGDSATPVLN